MWKLELFGVLVQVFLMASVLDIHVRSNISSKILCHAEALADRIVLIFLDHTANDEFVAIINSNSTGSKFKEMLKGGITGMTTVPYPLNEPNGILAITAGIEGRPFPIPKLEKQETVFSKMNITYYFGPVATINELDTTAWKINEMPLTAKIKNYKNSLNTDFTNVSTILKRDLPISGKKIAIFINTVYSKDSPPDKYEEKNNATNTNSLTTMQLIEEIVSAIVIKYPDKKTTFVVVVSPPLTNENKQLHKICPFAIWGSGLRHKSNVNISQVNINSIITAVLGLSPLKQSVGVLPRELLFSKSHQYYKCNALHLASIANYSMREVVILNNIARILKIKENESNYSSEEKYNSSIEIYDELIKTSLSKLHNSQFMMSRTIYYLSLIAYVGWIILLSSMLLVTIMEPKGERKHKFSSFEEKCLGFNTFFMLICTLSFVVVITHKWPHHYILYLIVPLLIWRMIMEMCPKWHMLISNLNASSTVTLAIYVLAIVVEVELLFWSDKYIYTSLIAFCIAVVYKTLMGIMTYRNPTVIVMCAMSGTAVVLTYFLPPISKFNKFILMNLSGIVWVCSGIISAFSMWKCLWDFIVMFICLVHYISSLVTMNLLLYSESMKLQNIVWILLASAILTPPLLGGRNLTNRLQQLAIVIASAISLFATKYECIIMFPIAVQYFCWYFLDMHGKNSSMKRSNAHYGCTFVLMLFATFKLIGSEEEQSLYDTSFVMRFIDSESKIVIATMIIIKHGLIVLLLFVIFKATYSSSTEGHFVLSILLLNLIGFRYFLVTNLIPEYTDISRQVMPYYFTQFLTIYLLMMSSFVKLITYGSLINIPRFCKERLAMKREQSSNTSIEQMSDLHRPT